MILIVANIGTAVVLFPILKRQNESLALGYVTARVTEMRFHRRWHPQHACNRDVAAGRRGRLWGAIIRFPTLLQVRDFRLCWPGRQGDAAE
jgi:hypothetical protein